ncbi:TRAP transporter small permease subunit [Rhodanobacter aciditrophus]|uniref:TRAP transporter small permease protein n=1 Tax=Rhodanobacter aciditrophus TaxID=1623218 RepID=A0ABW4AZJ9_9GAMM
MMGDQALAICNWLARWAARVAGITVLLAALLVSGDVIVRKLFGLTMGGSDELSGYALAIAVSWGSSSVLLNRSHIRIDVLYQYFPCAIQAVFNIISLVALASFVGLLVRYSWEVVFASWDMNSLSNTPLQTPLWLPQGLWFVGFCLFLITLIALLWNSLFALVKGDVDRVQQLLAPKSGLDEAQEEASFAKSQSTHREDV